MPDVIIALLSLFTIVRLLRRFAPRNDSCFLVIVRRMHGIRRDDRIIVTFCDYAIATLPLVARNDRFVEFMRLLRRFAPRNDSH